MARRANSAAAISDDDIPQEGKNTSDRWLRDQFDWNNIEHLIKTGRILSLVYDTETTDLNPWFAALTQFSGKVVDIKGRIIDEVKLEIQVPEDVVFSPQAALVTQSRPEEMYSAENRVPPHIAAGQIMLFFRNPYRKLWDQLEDSAINVENAIGKEKEVRVYTISNEDGTKQTEIRLHHGGKFLSYPHPDEDRLPDGSRTYRDPDGTRWKMIDSPALTEGYNNKRFDDRVLWASFHRAMSEEIFLTHTKKYRRFRVDTMDLAKLAAQLDDGGENGFKAGTNTDKKTGATYTSFKLSDLMEANTRDAMPERGLDEGVRMPDGSKYDRKRAHADAAYDVDATIALKAYLRKRVPEVVRVVEENSDFDRIKPFMINGEGFDPSPVRAFVRTGYPYGARLHFGVCANINEEIEERRQAVMIRTDLDQPLQDYTFRGKKLIDMSVDELTTMIKIQHGQPDALCEVINLRKNPAVVPAEMAFKRGMGGDPEQHEVNRRFVLANAEFVKKLMEAHSKSMPEMPDYRSTPNPQAEEHVFTGISSPKRYEFEMDGKQVLLTETVHAEWVKALRRNRTIDTTLRRALKPQPIEFETRPDTLYAFIDRMKKVDQDLQKYLREDADVDGAGKVSKLPSPDKPFVPPREWDQIPDPENPGEKIRVRHELTPEECEKYTANAVEYLWKLRAELMYEFHDNTTRFTVQRFVGSSKDERDDERYWHDVPFPEVNKIKQGDLAKGLQDDGEFRINMEELNWSSELIARMFRDANRIEWVKNYMAERGRDEELSEWKKWEEYFVAERALRFHGAPHVDADAQRWMTATEGLKVVAQIRTNIRTGDTRAFEDQWGQWDMFVSGGDKSEAILNEYEKLARRQLLNNPLPPEKLRLLGYDPETGLPIEHAPHEVPAGAKVLTLDVPDRMLERPLSHPHVASKILMLDLNDAQKQIVENADPDTYLFLRGAQSGRTYLAIKPAIISSKIAPSLHYQEVYDAAASRFEDSGMAPPPAEKFLPIAIEALEPKPAQVNSAVQTLKMPSWEDFIATVSTDLGFNVEPLTGLVVKDYGFKPQTGPARLQGMKKDEKKQIVTESGWEVPADIEQVRTMTLKEAREKIEAGIKQLKIATDLGFESIEELRDALRKNSITKAKMKEKRIINSMSWLHALIKTEPFTHADAVHYGYAGLLDMRSKLTALFADKEQRDVNRNDNLIHFVDIQPADKANMSWYRPTLRPMVHVSADVQDITPQPKKTALKVETPTPWAEKIAKRSGGAALT